MSIIIFLVSKVYLTVDDKVDCLYYQDFPMEILFIFERRRGQISTLLRPVKTFSCNNHLNCTCDDFFERRRYNCLVLFKNQLFDYNINKNYWKSHACINYKKKIDCFQLMHRYRIGGKNCRLSCLDLSNLGERIRSSMSRSSFTRLFLDGVLQ